MITRRKRPLNPLRQQRIQQQSIPQFKPKQTLPPLDLLADFQFTQKQQIKISDINIKTLLKDIYPYYTFSSITTCLIGFELVQYMWQQFHQNSSRYYKYFDRDYFKVSQFWIRLSIFIVYVNFLLIIGSYLQEVYRVWYIMCYLVSYGSGMIVFLIKLGSLQTYNSKSHIYTATYSIYLLILVQKKLKSNSLTQTITHIKQLSIWKKLIQLFNPKQNKQQQTQLIDFNFTQRPLSIKGGQTDDSFSYDSFFTYSDPLDYLSQQRSKSGYFQSNISKRSSFISSFPLQQQKSTNNITKFTPQNIITTNKSFLSSSSQIQSTIASSQLTKNQKLQQEQQMIKIYKTIIFSYLIYMNVSKVQWIAYLVAVCGVLAWVQILTNQKLKILKFTCLTFLALIVMSWF